MGTFAFRNPSELPAGWAEALAGAWLTNGYDHWPVPTERTTNEDFFQLERKTKESAMLSLLVPDKFGKRTITTSTLRPNAEPYQVPIELARGVLNRLRNLAQAVGSAGVTFPAELGEQIRKCTREFGNAISASGPEQELGCIATIGEALAASDAAMNFLAEQRLQIRLETPPGISTKFGCALKEPLAPEESVAFCELFNAVKIVPNWRSIEPVEAQFDWSALDRLVEWAVSQRLAITLGPIIDFHARCLPAWLRGQHDLPLLAAFMDDFIGTVVTRYRRSVSSFQLFAEMNSREEFDLIEDDRLRLAARLLESAAQIDSNIRWSYALHEPFGDYLCQEHNNYSPLVFADTLLRSGHEVAAVALDFGTGHPHDALDMLPLMDNFASIVTKLEIELGRNTAPGSHGMDLTTLRTALSCNYVEAITWQCWSRNPLGGTAVLFDPESNSTTALWAELRTLRSRWYP